MEKRKTKSFRKKIMVINIGMIAVLSVVIIVISLLTAGHLVIGQTQELAIRQEESSALTISQRMSTFYQMARLLRDDVTIHDDVQSRREDEEDYIVFSNKVYMKMLEIRSMFEDVDYMAILNYGQESVKYLGKVWVKDNTSVYNHILEDARKAEFSSYPGLRSSVSQGAFDKNQYSWNLYLPIYDDIKVTKEIGMAVISIGQDTLAEMFSNQVFKEAFLMDSTSRIISSKDSQQIGKSVSFGDKLTENKGVLKDQGKYVIYYKIQDNGWYLVSPISALEFFSGALYSFGLLLALAFGCCAVVSLLSVRLVKGLYHPLEDLKQRMHLVSSGDMKSRMEVSYEEEEFNEMAESFNKMVEDVENLMERIKQEQIQMKQIELNALQSQIKPHFLYNTLECIHWQALVEGDKKVSKLVKALAVYYRLCLNRGQDVVPLKQELEHIENYIVIQNMRYSDIIKFSYEIPENLLNVSIPQMTLQPLVENAIYHGIKVREDQIGTIQLTAEKDGDKVLVKLTDSGVGMPQEAVDALNANLSEYDESMGYGVHNVNKRLEIQFGPGYGLHYLRTESGGITVEISLPGKEAHIHV